MDILTFRLRCRTCHEPNPKPWAYNFDGQQAGQPLRYPTDAGLMQAVELANEHLGVRCPFCGAASLEVRNLALNGQLLFDYEALCRRYAADGLAVLAVTVVRAGDQQAVRLAISPAQVPAGFLRLAAGSLTELVQRRPTHDFAAAATTTGTFYGCVAGHWKASEARQYVLPQKYSCQGLTREDVLFALHALGERATPG